MLTKCNRPNEKSNQTKSLHSLPIMHLDWSWMSIHCYVLIIPPAAVSRLSSQMRIRLTWLTSNKTSRKADTALHGGKQSKFPLTPLDRYLGNFHFKKNYISQCHPRLQCDVLVTRWQRDSPNMPVQLCEEAWRWILLVSVFAWRLCTSALLCLERYEVTMLWFFTHYNITLCFYCLV